MATAELIATLILLKFSLQRQHPTSTLGRREGGPGSWAGVPSAALPCHSCNISSFESRSPWTYLHQLFFPLPQG